MLKEPLPSIALSTTRSSAPIGKRCARPHAGWARYLRRFRAVVGAPATARCSRLVESELVVPLAADCGQSSLLAAG